jgi:hypothetical protein
MIFRIIRGDKNSEIPSFLNVEFWKVLEFSKSSQPHSLAQA